MTIVPVGKLPLQVPESGSADFVMELVGQLSELVRYVVERSLEGSLETEVERFLGRKQYVRRRRAQPQESGVYCSRCRSHQRQDFRRNGHYRRHLAVHWGRVRLQVPQVKCQCGGNVRLRYQTLPARQRFWADLQVEIQAEYGRGQSYRQIKLALDQRLQSSVGLRTLNRQVLAWGSQEGSFPQLAKGEAPAVVRVDGIWITVMLATGEHKTDRLGRKRAVKRAKKVPILAAQGVWPGTGRTHLLAWMRADGEDSDSWQVFLEKLYQAGLTPEHGLRLLVADGAQGFRSAYENVYWQTPLQRCVFHKLQNLTQALEVPAEYDRQAARTFRTTFLRQAAEIWQAEDEAEARHRYQVFCETWRAQQPEAIRKLSRDFEATLTFYSSQEQAARQGEHWPAHLLRTTSPLERMFREFRRRYRQAVLFHSSEGLLALTAFLARRFS